MLSILNLLAIATLWYSRIGFKIILVLEEGILETLWYSRRFGLIIVEYRIIQNAQNCPSVLSANVSVFTTKNLQRSLDRIPLAANPRLAHDLLCAQ